MRATTPLLWACYACGVYDALTTLLGFAALSHGRPQGVLFGGLMAIVTAIVLWSSPQFFQREDAPHWKVFWGIFVCADVLTAWSGSVHFLAPPEKFFQPTEVRFLTGEPMLTLLLPLFSFLCTGSQVFGAFLLEERRSDESLEAILGPGDYEGGEPLENNSDIVDLRDVSARRKQR